jgi:hypothetical protein
MADDLALLRSTAEASVSRSSNYALGRRPERAQVRRSP